MTMYVCPKGHQSQAGDYCDECGAAIGGSKPAAPAAQAAQSAPATAAPTSTGAACPECGTPQAGRFCEVLISSALIARRQD